MLLCYNHSTQIDLIVENRKVDFPSWYWSRPVFNYAEGKTETSTLILSADIAFQTSLGGLIFTELVVFVKVQKDDKTGKIHIVTFLNLINKIAIGESLFESVARPIFRGYKPFLFKLS